MIHACVNNLSGARNNYKTGREGLREGKKGRNKSQSACMMKGLG